MTDKERLDALTMNLELTARELEDMRSQVSDLRGSVESLAMSTTNLLRISESHERRLTRIEGGAQ